MLTLLYFLASTTSWADLLFWLSKVIKSPCSLYLPILCLMQCFPNNQAATAGANIRRSGGLSSLLLPHGFGRPGSQPSSSNPSPSVPAAGNSAQSSFRPGSPSPSGPLSGCPGNSHILINQSVMSTLWPSPLRSTSLSSSLLP